MASKIDELLADFDGSEAAWQKAAKSGGFLLEVEKAVHEFLESTWPKIEPLVQGGIDFASIAAGAAAGPLGTLVSYVVSAFGKSGLNALIRFLALKTAPA